MERSLNSRTKKTIINFEKPAKFAIILQLSEVNNVFLEKSAWSRTGKLEVRLVRSERRPWEGAAGVRNLRQRKHWSHTPDFCKMIFANYYVKSKPRYAKEC